MPPNIEWPSTQNLKAYTNKQILNNCTITVDDIIRVNIMCGPAVSLLQGKMVQKNPNSFKIKRILLLAPILDHDKNLKLVIDFSAWTATHFSLPRVIN